MTLHMVLCGDDKLKFLLTAKRRPAQVGSQHGSVSSPTFLHAGIFAADVAWQPAVPRPHRPRTRPADV